MPGAPCREQYIDLWNIFSSNIDSKKKQCQGRVEIVQTESTASTEVDAQYHCDQFKVEHTKENFQTRKIYFMFNANSCAYLKSLSHKIGQ